MDFSKKSKYLISDLIEIIRLLRGENGCPWDRKQNHHSIRQNLIEEAYEVAEAIDLEDAELLKEELGDLLLQVVFHSSLEEDAGRFNFDDICDGICRKLIIRHPHIFSSESVSDDPEAVLKNWEAIKRKTKGQASVTESLRTVPKLPALMKSKKIQSRASKAGFDPFSEELLKEKLLEESKKFTSASDSNSQQKSLSNLLFCITNLCRKLNLEPEEALLKADSDFIDRFSRFEENCNSKNIDFSSISSEEALLLWEEAKEKYS